MQANKRKSVVLFLGMALCLLALGFIIGTAIEPETGGMLGLISTSVLWIILSLVSYFSGDSILLASSHAQEVSRDVHPQLFNVVEEMKIAANLPTLPRIYIIDEEAPNAFATGRSPEKSSVAVTAGLLSKLNRDELQGVIAHEISHIVNRDVLYMTCAGVLLGSITLISQVFFRGTLRVSNTSRRNHIRYRVRGRGSAIGSGQGQAILVLVAILFAVLAPILAKIFYFALSRKREYLADASGVRLTRYPEGLASALEKIAGSDVKLASANKITAPMYIADPFQDGARAFANLTSTHPPIEERIRILRYMNQGVNYSNYQKAFSKTTGRQASIIPPSGLSDKAPIEIRTSLSPALPVKGKKEETRELGDLMRTVNRYVFLTCVCGLRLKIPPDFQKPSVICPRCFQKLDIPSTKKETSQVL
ncbi:MAG: M48 family metallopeptidase [Candidatus Omnitrophica bacterium]|nr:M48 family metallopeptidase [Candidatus Omnitrophota bacterium]